MDKQMILNKLKLKNAMEHGKYSYDYEYSFKNEFNFAIK